MILSFLFALGIVCDIYCGLRIYPHFIILQICLTSCGIYLVVKLWYFELRQANFVLLRVSQKFSNIHFSLFSLFVKHVTGCFYGFKFEASEIFAEQTDNEDQRVRGSCVIELMDKLWTFS